MPSTNILGKVEIAHAGITKEVKNHQIALEFAKTTTSNNKKNDLQEQFNLFKEAYDLAMNTLSSPPKSSGPRKQKDW
jgi:hypothetical protein